MRAFVLTWLLASTVTAYAVRLRASAGKNNVDYKMRLTNHNSVQYSADLVLGHQTLPVIYDTGSFEIIVLSTLCKTCRSSSIYDSKQSSSFMNAGGVTAEHLFGSGPVVSEKGFETVSLGNTGSPYVATSMPFWQVISHEIAVWNSGAHFSGIVGLGFPDHVPKGFSAENADTITMLAAMGINTFALCLERGRPSAPGWLSTGPSVEKEMNTSPFHRLSVVGKVHWGVRMSSFYANGIGTFNPCNPSCGAIIDSGTSLIAVPPSAQPLVSMLTSMIKLDCSNLAQLPVLEFQLDGKLIRLPPAAYVMQVRQRTWDNSTIWRTVKKNTRPNMVYKCQAAFMNIDKESSHGPVWILGMPFLRYYYTVFDRAAKTIHVASATPRCEVSNSMPSFFNSTHLEGARGSATVGSFESPDYQPTEVDLNEARVPEWAITQGRDFVL